MAHLQRLPTTCVLIVCLAGTPWGDTLFASEPASPSVEHASSQPVPTLRNSGPTQQGAAPAASIARPFHFTLAEEALTAALQPGLEMGSFNALAQRGGRRGRGRGRVSRGGYRNGGAATALAFGALASIGGAAVLVYANRPECNGRPWADGCSYGTKVAGGALISAGMVGIIGGALAWR